MIRLTNCGSIPEETLVECYQSGQLIKSDPHYPFRSCSSHHVQRTIKHFTGEWMGEAYCDLNGRKCKYQNYTLVNLTVFDWSVSYRLVGLGHTGLKKFSVCVWATLLFLGKSLASGTWMQSTANIFVGVMKFSLWPIYYYSLERHDFRH